MDNKVIWTIKADSDVLVAIFHLNFESINKHLNEEPCIFQWVSAGESGESAELAKKVKSAKLPCDVLPVDTFIPYTENNLTSN